MPPRRTAVPASPAAATGRTVAPSPARSTRSRAGNHDDWENESVQSSFKAPTTKSKKANILSLQNTSVNVAAAFNAARELPTPTSATFIPPRSKATKPPPTSTPYNPHRHLSPSEELASTAQATSPVSFLLKGPKLDVSFDQPSFSSLGSGNTTYDYQREEALVRAARRKSGRGGKGDEDAPYRPGEDDFVYGYDSEESGVDEDGEGVVRGGGLEGRAESRGKRREQGEGYLGMGLGLKHARRRSRKKGDEELSGEEEVVEGDRETTPNGNDHSGLGRGFTRSPTPRNLLRALTPMMDRNSPAPTPGHLSRRRQPSPLRIAITNILPGIALTLRFFVNLGLGVLQGVSRLIRRMKKDWWKYLGGFLALGLALRLGEISMRGRGGYTTPLAPPSNMDEVVTRLTNLEHALGLLSDSSKLLADAEREVKISHDRVVTRISHLEGSLENEVKKLDIVSKDGEKGLKGLQGDLAGLRGELGDLKTKYGRLKGLEGIDGEVRALNERVGVVEFGLKSALDDGRLRDALERILPDNMVVKKNAKGTVDIDPVFWSELRKMLVGKGEVESMVRQAMSGKQPATFEEERDFDAWGEKLFAKKAKEGVIIARDDFLRLLNTEIATLRLTIDSLPRQSAQNGKTTVISPRGEDVTSALQDLIDAALLRYSKDTIARPDYALFTAGARVVPSITSDTLLLRNVAKSRWLFWGAKNIQGRSPATALHPDISVGSCWPFEGGQGQLGVLLNRRVKVGDITVEHAAKDIALDISTAPRGIEVYGLVEGEENRHKVEEYLSRRNTEDVVQASSDHLLLANITYDPNLPHHIQTFPVDPLVASLDVDVGIVIFKVLSNWGGDFTCLYRVRVHGEAVDA